MMSIMDRHLVAAAFKESLLAT